MSRGDATGSEWGNGSTPGGSPSTGSVTASHQGVAHTSTTTGAESFWYVLQCIAFGAGYFTKIPTKKALSEIGAAKLTSAEQFWYVLQCICFGAGYFAKVPVKKALSECAFPTQPRT